MFKTELLTNYARLLQENGFTIIRTMYGEELPTWFYFAKDGKIGTVQEDRGEFSIDSVAIPNCNNGTGTQIYKGFEATIAQAERALAYCERGSERFASLEVFISYKQRGSLKTEKITIL